MGSPSVGAAAQPTPGPKYGSHSQQRRLGRRTSHDGEVRKECNAALATFGRLRSTAIAGLGSSACADARGFGSPCGLAEDADAASTIPNFHSGIDGSLQDCVRFQDSVASLRHLQALTAAMLLPSNR
jgi:hypothetical protein